MTRTRRPWLRLAQFAPLIVLALIVLVEFSVPSGIRELSADVSSGPDQKLTPSMLREAASLPEEFRIKAAADLENTSPTSLAASLDDSWSRTSERQSSFVTSTSISALPFSSEATPYAAIRAWESRHGATVWAWVAQPGPAPSMLASATGDAAALKVVSEQIAYWPSSDRQATAEQRAIDYFSGTMPRVTGALPPLDPSTFEPGGATGVDTADMVATAAAHDGRLYAYRAGFTNDQDSLQVVPGVPQDVLDADPTARGFQALVAKTAKREKMNLWVFGPLTSRLTPLRAPGDVTAETAAAVGRSIWPAFPGRDGVASTDEMGPLPQEVSKATGGTFGWRGVRSMWTSPDFSSPAFSADQIAPQTVVYLAVFPEVPGGTPTPSQKARSQWAALIASYYPWLSGGLFAMLVVSLFASPAAFIYDRRLRARDRIKDEMERMQRDAHDKVYNRLSALSKRVAGASDAARADLASTLRTIAEDIRTTVGELQGILGEDASAAVGTLATLPLAEQIRAVCRAQARRLDIDVRFEPAPRPIEASPRAGWDLQCIAEEALTNAVRHGGATRVTVQLRADNDAVILRIADNGHGVVEGFSIDDVPDTSTGLRGARERVRRLGGQLEVESTAEGTTVTASVPSSR